MQVINPLLSTLCTATSTPGGHDIDRAGQQASDILSAFASAAIPLGMFFATLYLTVFLLIIGAETCRDLVREMEARLGVSIPFFGQRRQQQGVVPYTPGSVTDAPQSSMGSQQAGSHTQVWVPPAQLDAETLEETAWLEGELDEPSVEEVHPFLGEQFGIDTHRKR